MKRILLAIAVMLAAAVNARSFNMNDFSRAMNDVQSVVNDVGNTVQSFEQTTRTVAYPRTGQSHGSSGKVDTRGPKAKLIKEQVDKLFMHVAEPLTHWFRGLEEKQQIIYGSVAGFLLIVPLLAYLVMASGRGIPGSFTKCVSSTAALGGVVFTILVGFEIGGDIGEWMAIAVMVFLGLAGLEAVLIGLMYGQGIIFKLFAPVMLLELAIISFIAAMYATIIFMAILIVVFLLSAFVSSGSGNYVCPDCGRRFNYKPSSCSCGARFN